MWGDLVARRGGGGGGGGRHLTQRREAEADSESQRENILRRVLRGVKRLTQTAWWENHVLENFLVYDPSPQLHLHTQMGRHVCDKCPRVHTW